MGRFTGFTPEALNFLQGLHANNTRDWFKENQPVFEASVKRPADAFGQAICPPLASLTGLPHKARMFRLLRDLRYSKDQRPYTARLQMAFSPLADLPESPTFLFDLQPDRLSLGFGVKAFSPVGLEEFRKRILKADGAHLAAALTGLNAEGVRLGEPELKRVPEGYPRDHPRAQLLRRKGLVIWLDFPADNVLSEDLVERVVAQYAVFMPVYSWLAGTQAYSAAPGTAR